MSQRTVVIVLERLEGLELEARLRQGAFEWRTMPHARFSVRGEGVVATCYQSGKLVIQGAAPEAFARAYLGRELQAPEETPPPKMPEGPSVGSDEAGKGDFFGPLVVVALRLEPDEAQALQRGGLRESKTISDARCRQVGAALIERYAPAVERLDPEAYNAEYARIGNLNSILTDLHRRAVRRVAEPGDTVVIDQFAPPGRMERALFGRSFELVQMPRAERVPAVGAASLVARFLFLEALQELSREAGVDLAKGAGVPADDAARALLELHGHEGLGRFAKLHFSNARRLLDRGRP